MTKEQIEEALAPGQNSIRNNIDGATAPFAQAYKYLFNTDVCPTCPGELYDAYIKVKNSYLQKIEHKMANQKYTIKRGSLIDAFFAKDASIQNHWTADNITDEVAAKLLKEGIGKDVIIKNSEEVEEESKPVEEKKK